jgi:hypothetical protein
MRRIFNGVILGLMLALLIAVPVLAAYYAYISVHETSGNDYSNLPIIVSRNITQLVDYDLMSSTGLDSRVLTGSGETLPHMLADDKVLFVSDLAAHENKSLIFYLGATSLSSFPIVVGYNGSFTTPDDPDLELGYQMELLISGYFNADAGDVGNNYLYKEDAFRVSCSAAHTIRIAALDNLGAEVWEMHDSTFTTGYHSVYVVCNGLFGLLYVDDFGVAKDTTALFTNVNWQLASQTDTGLTPMARRTVYAEGRYWAFFLENGGGSDHIYWSSSTDGASWEAVDDIDVASVTSTSRLAICFDGTYVHVVVDCIAGSPAYHVLYYFRGDLVDDGTISWDAQDTIVAVAYDQGLYGVSINVDSDGYPFVLYGVRIPTYPGYYGAMKVLKSSTNDGTWTTAGGYPQNLDYDTSSPYYDTQRLCYLAEFHGTTHFYAVYSDDGHHSSSNTYALMGNYFNGSSWSGSADTIFDGYSTSQYVTYFDAVCDDDGNMYIVWTTNTYNTYMRIRYADTSWGTITLISASAKQPSISYSPISNCVYVAFIYGSSVYGVSIFNGEVSHSGVLFTPTSVTGATMCNSGYSDYSGILYCISGQIQHSLIGWYWTWNDNGNDWIWMADNTMPYISDAILAVDGVTQLEYQPADIIEGTTLPDEESDHDAVITWGSNPSGVSATLSAFAEEGTTPPVSPSSNPGSTDPDDMIGPTGQPGWTSTLPTLTGNPLYPLIKAFSDLTHFPVGLGWIFFATFWVLAAMLAAYSHMPHQVFTVLIGGGVSALFYAMGIYPFWVMFIFVAMALAVVVMERSPTIG